MAQGEPMGTGLVAFLQKATNPVPVGSRPHWLTRWYSSYTQKVSFQIVF